MIRSKDFKRIEYSLDDLNNFMAQSQKLIDSVVLFVDFIATSGKGLVFEADVRRIFELLDEIKSIHKEQLKQIYQNRRAVYKKMIAKIEDEL